MSNYLKIFCHNNDRKCVGKSPRESSKRDEGKTLEKENRNGPSALEKIIEEFGCKQKQKVLLPRLFN